MKKYNNNGIITLAFNGHIDSVNAVNVESEINSALDGYTNDDLILDFDELTYISSVGLRIILRLKKSHKNTKIINISLQ